MDELVKNLRALRVRGMKRLPTRGNSPTVSLTNDPTTWVGLRVFLGTGSVVFVVSWLTLTWIHKNGALDRASGYGIIAGLSMALLYYL